MNELDNRAIIVTGGSRGLGRAIVRALCSAGADVTFTYRARDDDAAATAAETGARAVRGDVRDAAHAAEVVREVVARTGGLHGLVNNAAVTHVLPVGLVEEKDFDEVIDTNLKGAFLFTRAALRPMIKARAGVIVNIGSFAGGRVTEVPVHYAASKAALVGMTRALAAEVGRYGVRVCALSPGLVDEGMGARLPAHRVEDFARQSALGRTATADEIAEAARFLLSDASALLTGADLAVGGGL